MRLKLRQKPFLPLIAKLPRGMKGGSGKNPPIRGFAVATAFPGFSGRKGFLPEALEMDEGMRIENTEPVPRLTQDQGFRSLDEIIDELRAVGRLPGAPHETE